jgi:hypothetical protein
MEVQLLTGTALLHLRATVPIRPVKHLGPLSKAMKDTLN